MTTLQISKEKAKELYTTASTEFKTMLEETFGKDFFKVSIMDRVKSFEDAYRIAFRCDYPESSSWARASTVEELAFFKLKIIAEVLNEGKEGIYFPCFKSQRFEFSNSWIPGDTYYPRKLLLATKELSDYAGTQFIELYKNYLL